MAAMKTVALRGNWAGNFQRSVYDNVNGKREKIGTLVFSPGELVEVDDVQYAAIKDDIGAALIEYSDAELTALRARKVRKMGDAVQPEALEQPADDQETKLPEEVTHTSDQI